MTNNDQIELYRLTSSAYGIALEDPDYSFISQILHQALDLMATKVSEEIGQ